MDDSSIDTLIDELSSFELPRPGQSAPLSVSQLSDREVNQYILDKAKALIETGVSAVQDMAPYVAQTSDPESVAALAELMSATTRAIEALNRGNLLEKKAAKDEKIKRLEIQGRKEIATLQAKSNTTNNLNVLVASREEIFKKLFDEPVKVLELEG